MAVLQSRSCQANSLDLKGQSQLWDRADLDTCHFEKRLPQPEIHPWRPKGSQSGREKGRDESFQVRAKKPLGTNSHRAISKNSRGCRPLIGHKKCFVLLCPIGEQFLPSSFREFVHDGYCLATLARFVHQACASKGNFYFLLS